MQQKIHSACVTQIGSEGRFSDGFKINFIGETLDNGIQFSNVGHTRAFIINLRVCSILPALWYSYETHKWQRLVSLLQSLME